MPTFKELVAEARDLESRGQWTAARQAYDAARRASKTKKDRAVAAGKVAEMGVRAELPPPAGAAETVEEAREEAAERQAAKVAAFHERVVEGGAGPAAVEEDPRAARNGLKPGDVLKHTIRGQVVAECRYEGARRWVYGSTTYTSCSAAANAAAADIEQGSRTLNGWVFWGVEKRDRS